MLRTIVLLLGVVGVLAAGAVVARKKGWFRQPEPEAFDPEELAVLKTAPLVAIPAADAKGGWPQWRGPNRDGVAPPGPLRAEWETQPPTRLWSVPVGGGYSSFAVVGGGAYTQDKQGEDERILCMDAATGTTAWEYRYPVDYRGIGYGNGPRATPTVHDGRVYTVGAVGTFLCLEPPIAPGQPAKELWRHDLLAEFEVGKPDFGVACSPLIEGDLVVVQPGGPKGALAAFDRKTGDLRWAAGADPWSYSSPVAATAAGVRQVVAASGNSVLGVRADDGKVLWRHPWETQYQANIATPVVVGDYVFVSSGYNKGCALLRLRPDGGGVKADQVYFRSNRVMRNHFNTCVYRDGFLYGFDDPGGLKCVDLRNGELVADWEGRDADNKAFDKGTLILAGDKMVGLTTTGTVFLAEADPTEFKFRGKVKDVLSGGECWAVPVLVDGRLYVRDGEKAVCLDMK